ncbi:SAM-dependent methyltransferase [Allobranchiibius huperziae]|uniref:SAM-dependent methyltransferase n=1 Tax=Allobranchiibius huperziae TaxID=1874116 RepID=A0A853DIR9_9MICO|nr:SAM-dependent methyltransferase [Allobranchiibius huperziae]
MQNRRVADDAMIRRAKSFESGAGAYERFRPEYPEALFDDLLASAGPLIGRGVLEVGAGTGRATLPLARRGVRLEVIEPSQDMLRVLRDRLTAEHLLDAVTIRRGTFEDIDVAEAPFGVVVAGQSFHWTDPRTRWSKLATLLGEDGIAFLFWNAWHLDPTHHDLDAVRRVYSEDDSGLVPDIEGANPVHGSSDEEQIAADPALTTAVAATYRWDRALPVHDYLSLLSTTSSYAVAGPDDRRRLFTALRPVLGATVRLRGSTLSLSTRAAGRG